MKPTIFHNQSCIRISYNVSFDSFAQMYCIVTCSSVVITHNMFFGGYFFHKHRAKKLLSEHLLFSHTVHQLFVCIYNTIEHYFIFHRHYTRAKWSWWVKQVMPYCILWYKAIMTPVSFVWTVTQFIHNNKQIQLYTKQPFQLKRELNKTRSFYKSIKCRFVVIKVKPHVVLC